MKTHTCINRLFMALVLLGWSVVMANGQTTVVAEGTCGDNLTWVLTSDYTLTISGSGAMANYSNSIWYGSFPPWDQYRTNIENVVIASSVTAVGSYAFYEFSSFNSSIDLSNIVTIGSGAFYQSAITAVTFSGLLTEVGQAAFSGTGLTSVTIPENVTTIGSGAFSNCTSLETINYNATNCTSALQYTAFSVLNIGSAVRVLPKNFVSGNTALSTVTWGGGVTEIGESAFSDCTALTSVELPNSVVKIGGYAFRGSGLVSLTIPESVATIGWNAFANCEGLKTVNYNAANLGEIGFSTSSVPFGTGGGGVTVNIGASVDTIPFYLFAYWKGLQTVNFNSDKLKYIGNLTFFRCSNLTDVTIPESVTSIGLRAFAETGITSLTIPEHIDSIDSYAFEECESLTTLYYNATNCRLAVAPFSSCTSLATLIIGNGVTAIPNSAFAYPSITSITFGEDVTTIGDYAFYGCGITSLTIPETFTAIGAAAFGNCSQLNTINFNANCTVMGNINYPVFYGSPALTTLNIGDNVTTIPDFAFQYLRYLESIDFGASQITAIGAYAFQWCGLKGDFVIPATVQSIGDGAFEYSNFSSLTVPEQLVTVGTDAFRYCDSLKTINYNTINWNDDLGLGGLGYNDQISTLRIGNKVRRIPGSVFSYSSSTLSTVDFSVADSLKTIGSGAFSSCPALTSVTLPESLDTVGNYAFYYSGLTSITIPEQLAAIGFNAFADCANLQTVNYNAANCLTDNPGGYGNAIFQNTPVTTVNFGNMVKHIPNRLFSNNSELTTVVFGEDLESIGEMAFYNCDLSAIDFPGSLTQIDKSAFSNCTAVASITTHAITPPVLSSGVFYGISQNIPVYIPCLTRKEYEKVGEYSYDDWGYYFDNFIVNGPVSDTTYYEVTKCYGVPYTDQNFPEPVYYAGNHYATLENAANCDSVVCLVLSEYPNVQGTYYQATLCQGGSYSDEHFTNLTTSGYHELVLQNANGCDSIISVYLNYAVSPPQELCMISVDMEYHNQIVWKRQQQVTAYNIYREGSVTGNYELAATIPYDGDNSWIDPQSNARVRSYSYKVAAIDTCGYESVLSAPHKTMHLTINQGMGSWNLIWTPYEGTGYATYNIYRAIGDTFNGELELVSTIPSSLTSFTDFISTGSQYVYYMVEIVLSEPCATGAKQRADETASIRSNIATNNPDGASDINSTGITGTVHIYPNPFTDAVHITGATGSTVHVTDAIGSTVYTQPVNGNNATLQLGHLPSGIYFFLFEKNGKATTVKAMKR